MIDVDKDTHKISFKFVGEKSVKQNENLNKCYAEATF